MLIAIYQCMYCQKATQRRDDISSFDADDFVEEDDLGLEYVNLRLWVVCPRCKLLTEGGV